MQTSPKLLTCGRFPLLAAKVVFAASTLVPAGFLSAAEWSGGDADWQTDSWGLSGGFVGDDNHEGVGATIEGASVTVNANIPLSIGSLAVRDATLNINADLSSTSGAWIFQGHSTVNQTAGNVIVSGLEGIDFGYNVMVNEMQWNLSGGSIDVVSRGFTLGRAGPHASSGECNLFISGTATLSTGRDIWLNAENAMLHIDASSGVSLSTGKGYGIRLDASNIKTAVLDSKTRIVVNGYNAETLLVPDTMNIYQGALADGESGGSASSAVATFILSSDPEGVNPWTTRILNLGDGSTNAKGDLEVDVSQLSGTHSITLFSFESLVNAPFGKVTVVSNGAELVAGADPSGSAAALNNNEFFVDYESEFHGSITLHYKSVR